MNVLSLFDGVSCGQVALNRAGIPFDNYFASEIDKYAIQIAKKNHPEIQHIGDVTKVKGSDLSKIDLLMGGSPCQGFSIAGKQLNFDDPRSKLFFEFVRLLKECKPKYFLLENVRMKQEYQNVISEALDVDPILINSGLVSAQDRKRLYWTNIPNITQPEDKGLIVADIIDEHPPVKNRVNGLDFVEGIEKGRRLYDGKNLSRNFRQGSRVYSTNGKSPTLTSQSKGGPGGYTGLFRVGTATDIKGFDIIKRIYSIEGKCPTVNTCGGGNREPKIAIDEKHWRKLTPIEVERTFNLPDDYTKGVSNSQRYKMLGNGWTIDVIVHILKHMNGEVKTTNSLKDFF